jgi:hypothetical protein
MYEKFTTLSNDGDFCGKFVADLGLLKYGDDFYKAFTSALVQNYGEEDLDVVGNAYHDIAVFRDHNFHIMGLSNLTSDAEVVSAWDLLLKSAGVRLVHIHDGIVGRLAHYEWTFEVNIGNPSAPLWIEVWIEVKEKQVSTIKLFRDSGENFEKEWLVFLLRYL